MIIYVTKETARRYKLIMPEGMRSPINKELASLILEREGGNKLFEWGAKLFYFDRRKCLQIVNFASKLTLFLVDVKVKDLDNFGNVMANYMFYIYENNPEMTKMLEHYFEEAPIAVISSLKDKSIIATLNHTQSNYALDGYRLYDFIENGILQTRKFNKLFNTDWPLGQKINGKTEYFYSAEKFEQLLKARYSE